MSPKPILKGSKPDGFRQPQYYNQTVHQHHSVHFPPSPALTRTFLAHSPSAYDRSPIVVSQNDCALPERGCPGRTYFEESPSGNSRRLLMINTKGYHPRAFSASSNYDVPPLVPDISSESDESDAVAGFPPPSSVTFGPHGLPSSSTARVVTNTLDIAMHTHDYVACDQDAALAFLPHSPYEDTEDSLHKEKLRRRRDKKHERSADAYRISGGDAHIAQFAHAFSCLSVNPPSPSRSPPSTPKKKSHRRQSLSSFTPTFSNYPNDGCLGGF